MSIEQSIKNAALASGGLVFTPKNTPTQYATRQRQYMDNETRAFTQKYARYASDFFTANVQGLDPDNPQEWLTARLRMADIVRPSSAIQRHFDDYKMVLFESAYIVYLRPGTKIETMGNTWLVINPANVSGASGSGLVRRCNAVWNYLDYYGNVVSEPIIVENDRANANDTDVQQSQLITKGYFNVTCQYNEATAQINTNTRMILGSAAYRVTGYSDFETEFTGDYGTIRLLSFTIRYEEPNETIDDMENHVAGGKVFSWDISISGQTNLKVGATAQLTAQSSRNDEIVTSTTEYPITYEWESSDESIITVDDDGTITAIAEGTATVRAQLSENAEYFNDITITVTESTDGVEFTSDIPTSLSAYESVTISAALFADGEETSEVVAWDFSGADNSAYTAEVNGNAAVITCYGYDETPLTVKAYYGTYEATKYITLEGI